MGYRWWLAALMAAACLAALPADAACKVERVVELPITMQGSRALVDTQINGRDAPFILDSGAFYSTISPPVAQAFGLPREPMPGFYLRGIGGSTDAWATTVKKFTLAGVTIPNVQFVVGGTDIGHTGLLGQNVLGLADVEYDLPGGAVRLFKPQGCGKLGMAYWTEGKPFFTLPIQSRDVADRHTIGTVELDGAKLAATFDTGATTVVSLRAAARAGVKPGDPGVEAGGWASGLGRRVTQGWIGRFKLLRIGDEELHNVRLRIADLGIDTDMLIGIDYFVSHRIFVANSQQRMYFTYTGGRLFDANARIDPAGPVVANGASAAAPTDADGFSRRGAMLQTQRDLPGAVAAFGKAIALAPKDPRYPLQRALAYLEQGRHEPAMDDLGATLKLDPGNTRARLLRAQLRSRAEDRDGAIADLDQVAAALPRQDAARLELGHLYTANDAFAPAIAQFGLWLASHPGDARRSMAQNGRCWARTLGNRELEAARADCEGAVRAVPTNASFLDSRATLALRRGDAKAALADYNAALALDPDLAWSRYCRGLAEKRLGMDAEAKRDMEAASARDHDVVDRAKRYGLT